MPLYHLVSANPKAAAAAANLTQADLSYSVQSRSQGLTPLAVVTHPVFPPQHHAPAPVHKHKRRHHAAGSSSRSPAAQGPASAKDASATTLSCTGASGMLPQNYAAIVTFFTAHGYTALAAAGIAGNMYQESGGNPESVGSGGGGLIGFTPLPAGYVTGNVAADLQTQLQAVLAYNQQWSQYIPALNAATSATQAADIYMNDFERPGIPAAYNREAAAQAVATACGL